MLLVGNKADLKNTTQASGNNQQGGAVEEIANKINREFHEVEMWLECSAKNMTNTNDLLFYAQKSAVCPQRVIFDSANGQLTEGCRAALQRIFTLCDKDGDGVLNDRELNDFEVACFGTSLEPQELEGVKNMVRARCPHGVTARGLNGVGFLALQSIFIHDSQPEIPWSVLRKFGYGLDLKLTDEFLNPPINVSGDQSAELSNLGITFFTELFHRYDQDHDGALNSAELENLFATTPGLPWEKTFSENTHTDPSGNITLRGFLSLWNMTTLLDFSTTLHYLAYLGCENPKDALQFPHRTIGNSKNNPAVLPGMVMCYVLGPVGSGKTALLKSFLEKPFSDIYVPTSVPFSATDTVPEPLGTIPPVQRYLTVTIHPWRQLEGGDRAKRGAWGGGGGGGGSRKRAVGGNVDGWRGREGGWRGSQVEREVHG